jgi:hypothetical protein
MRPLIFYTNYKEIINLLNIISFHIFSFFFFLDYIFFILTRFSLPRIFKYFLSSIICLTIPFYQPISSPPASCESRPVGGKFSSHYFAFRHAAAALCDYYVVGGDAYPQFHSVPSSYVHCHCPSPIYPTQTDN